MRCQRWFLGIRWFEQDYNTTVQSTTDLTTIGFLLQNHPLSLFIHVARLSPDVLANQILEFKCTMETSSHHILPGSDCTVAQEKHGWTKLNCLLTHYQFCGQTQSTLVMERRNGLSWLCDNDDDDKRYMVLLKCAISLRLQCTLRQKQKCSTLYYLKCS